MVLILGIQKYDTIMLKKATMLEGKENYTCVSLIESNIFFLSRCFKGSSNGNTNTNTHIGHNLDNFSNWTI
jgi:hypothetical protein